MKFIKLFFLLFAFALPLAACDSDDGDMEELGEDVDNAVEDTADNIEDAADDASDSMD